MESWLNHITTTTFRFLLVLLVCVASCDYFASLDADERKIVIGPSLSPQLYSGVTARRSMQGVTAAASRHHPPLAAVHAR